MERSKRSQSTIYSPLRDRCASLAACPHHHPSLPRLSSLPCLKNQEHPRLGNREDHQSLTVILVGKRHARDPRPPPLVPNQNNSRNNTNLPQGRRTLAPANGRWSIFPLPQTMATGYQRPAESQSIKFQPNPPVFRHHRLLPSNPP